MSKNIKKTTKSIRNNTSQRSARALRLHLISRWATIIGVLLMIFLFSMILIVSRQAIRQPQDVRRDAMVVDGSVKLITTLSPAQIRVGQSTNLHYSISTGATHINGVELLFDIITDTLESSEIQIVDQHPNLVFAYQELDEVEHGFKVRIIALTRTPTQGFSAPTPEQFFTLQFSPKQVGSIEIDFDIERSLAPEFRSDPLKDQLLTIAKQTFVVEPADIALPPDQLQLDDLYFSETRLDRDLRFFSDDDRRTPLAAAQLESGKTYRFSAVARIANRVNQPSAISTENLQIRLRAGNREMTQAIPYQSLLRSGDSIAVVFENSFTVTQSNTFSFTLDPDNRIAESSTANNTISHTFTIGQTTEIAPPPVSCNERCSSNAECPVNFRCYDTGSDGKRCRLATNVSSTSCSTSTSTSTQTSTQAPTVRTAAPPTIRSCNQACASNRDCDVNMRCYQGACRLATNPTSLSCTSADAGVVSETYQKKSTQPAATPQPVPSASPSPSPFVMLESELPSEPPSDESAWTTLWASVMNNWRDLFSSNPLFLPAVILGLGLVLVIAVLVLSLRPNRTKIIKDTEAKPSANRLTQSPPPAQTAEFGSNPPPVTLSGHGMQQPMKQGQTSSMLQRMQAKGIQKPGK